jgi:hypothetical protein
LVGSAPIGPNLDVYAVAAASTDRREISLHKKARNASLAKPKFRLRTDKFRLRNDFDSPCALTSY